MKRRNLDLAALKNIGISQMMPLEHIQCLSHNQETETSELFQ